MNKNWFIDYQIHWLLMEAIGPGEETGEGHTNARYD